MPLLRLVLMGILALLSQPLWAHERCNPTGDGYRNTSAPAVRVTGPDITVTTPDVNVTNNIPVSPPAHPLTVQGNLNCPVINGTDITIHGSVNCGGRRNWGFWSLNYNEDVLNAANILKYCGTALTADQARKAVENFTLIYTGWQQFDIKDNWYRQIDYLDACDELKRPDRGFPA